MYQTDPDALPDGHFAPGELRWLVAGNRGRLLDARRTPVRVTGIDVAHGYFEAEILAFEDAGARWLVPLEEVTSYQFAPDGAQVPPGAAARMEAAIGRLNVTVDIPVDQRTRQRSQQRIAAERARADAWLTAHGAPAQIDPGAFIASCRGSAEAIGWLAGYLAAAGPDGLPGLDDELAASYVSNPWSGDLVRAHLITIARLGLAPYRGKAVRDPASLAGRRAEHRRAEHIIHRAAFTQALWQRADRPGLMIYRGIGLPEGASLTARATGLFSASFSRAVAESHFDAPRAGAAALLRRRLPLDLLFMSFLETEAMNKHYLEADAVLFASGGLL
jgi:hypothetical protein